MITPDGFLFQAKNLLKNNNEYPPEVDFKSAISRAYYSLYYEAYARLKRRYKNRLVSVVLDWLGENKSYNDRLVRELDEKHLIGLGINFHSLISQVLSDIRYELGQDFKYFRTQRDYADYELSLILCMVSRRT
jgi:hypothetical protein